MHSTVGSRILDKTETLLFKDALITDDEKFEAYVRKRYVNFLNIALLSIALRSSGSTSDLELPVLAFVIFLACEMRFSAQLKQFKT